MKRKTGGKAHKSKITIDGNSLDLEMLMKILDGAGELGISSESMKRVTRSRRTLESVLKDGRQVYGVNTGFGELQNKRIDASKARELQENLVRSTSAGVGPYVSERESRAILALRLNTLAKGFSGVRPELVNLLLGMLNRGIYPAIPEKGSVGASGDLAPLAHAALVLMGEGKAFYRGKLLDGGAALAKAGLKPIKLAEKEGLALINGTQFMTAIGAIAIADVRKLLLQSIVVFCMTLESLGGKLSPFDERVTSLRPHPGSARVAGIIRSICSGGRYQGSTAVLQDPYTLRCAPQVIGPLFDMLDYCQSVLEREMNSTTDNPLVMSGEGDIISAGNFHGQPIAVALDSLCIPLQALSSFSERRTARLVDSKLSGLNAFLSRKPGLESGYMVAQYTAAALVSEGKVLSHPSSSDSITTSANQEDFVSMGAFSALKLRQMVENAYTVVAIEALCAAQALDLRGRIQLPALREAHRTVRSVVPELKHDRELAGEIERCRELLRKGALLRLVR